MSSTMAARGVWTPVQLWFAVSCIECGDDTILHLCPCVDPDGVLIPFGTADFWTCLSCGTPHRLIVRVCEQGHRSLAARVLTASEVAAMPAAKRAEIHEAQRNATRPPPPPAPTHN